MEPFSSPHFFARTNIQRRLAPFEVSEPSAEDWIALDFGRPDERLFPWSSFEQAWPKALSYEAGSALQYGGGNGGRRLKRFLSQRFSRLQGMPCSEDEVLITNGTAQSFDLLGNLFLEAGDEVWVEDPTYFGALQTFAVHDATCTGFPMDAQGVRVDLMEAELERRAAKGERPPKFVYVIPNFHNPTGRCMGVSRRQHLANLARRFDLYIVEDDAYGELSFGPLRPSIRSLVHERTIYLYTFSKTIAPGFRMGAVAADREVVKALLALQVEAATNPLMQQVMAEILANIDYDAHLMGLRWAYRDRRDAMGRALETYLSDFGRWEVPEGGFFFWFQPNRELPLHTVLSYAHKEKVSFIGGSPFFVSPGDRASLRLSFSYYEPDRLVEGIRRIGAAISSYMEDLESAGREA